MKFIFPQNYNFKNKLFGIIDYTNLFKIDNNNLTKEVVSIKYSNINKINSLEK